MAYKRLLPSEEICLKLLKDGNTIKDIYKTVGSRCSTSKYLCDLAKNNGIKIFRKVKEKSTVDKYVDLVSYYVDNFKVKDQVVNKGRVFTIDAISPGSKKTYHGYTIIKNNIFRESFHACDIKLLHL